METCWQRLFDLSLTLGHVLRVRSLAITPACDNPGTDVMPSTAAGNDGFPEGVGAEAADQNHMLSGKQHQSQHSLSADSQYFTVKLV